MRTRVVEQFMIHLYFCRWLNTLEFLTRMCEAKTGTKTEDWRKDAKSKSKFVRSCLCHLGSSSLQMKWRACSSSNRLTWSFNSSITCKTVSQDAGVPTKSSAVDSKSMAMNGFSILDSKSLDLIRIRSRAFLRRKLSRAKLSLRASRSGLLDVERDTWPTTVDAQRGPSTVLDLQLMAFVNSL